MVRARRHRHPGRPPPRRPGHHDVSHLRPPAQVTFTDGEPVADAELRLWFPNTACDHVLDDICAHANLYCNAHHVADHTPPAGRALTIPQAAAVGRTTWHDASDGTSRWQSADDAVPGDPSINNGQ
jgi:hypothetical protein